MWTCSSKPVTWGACPKADDRPSRHCHHSVTMRARSAPRTFAAALVPCARSALELPGDRSGRHALATRCEHGGDGVSGGLARRLDLLRTRRPLARSSPGGLSTAKGLLRARLRGRKATQPSIHAIVTAVSGDGDVPGRWSDERERTPPARMGMVCRGFRGDGPLASQATTILLVRSNPIGVSLLNRRCRACRSCQVSRYSEMSLASSSQVFPRRRNELSRPQAIIVDSGPPGSAQAPHSTSASTGIQASEDDGPALCVGFVGGVGHPVHLQALRIEEGDDPAVVAQGDAIAG
jgi:hypothetical protein